MASLRDAGCRASGADLHDSLGLITELESGQVLLDMYGSTVRISEGAKCTLADFATKLSSNSTHMVRLKNPPHPGELIRTEIIEALGLNISKAAQVLKVRRATLSDLLHGKAALTPEMALRLEKAFGPDMQHLLHMQLAYDVANMRRHETHRREAIRSGLEEHSIGRISLSIRIVTGGVEEGCARFSPDQRGRAVNSLVNLVN